MLKHSTRCVSCCTNAHRAAVHRPVGGLTSSRAAVARAAAKEDAAADKVKQGTCSDNLHVKPVHTEPLIGNMLVQLAVVGALLPLLPGSL